MIRRAEEERNIQKARGEGDSFQIEEKEFLRALAPTCVVDEQVAVVEAELHLPNMACELLEKAAKHPQLSRLKAEVAQRVAELAVAGQAPDRGEDLLRFGSLSSQSLIVGIPAAKPGSGLIALSRAMEPMSAGKARGSLRKRVSSSANHTVRASMVRGRGPACRRERATGVEAGDGRAMLRQLLIVERLARVFLGPRFAKTERFRLPRSQDAGEIDCQLVAARAVGAVCPRRCLIGEGCHAFFEDLFEDRSQLCWREAEDRSAWVLLSGHCLPSVAAT